MNTLGQKITELRKVKGLSQEGLAQISKLNVRTIQRIENNQTQPRGETLILMSQALGEDLHTIVHNLNPASRKTIIHRLLNLLFFALLNLLFMMIIGYLTLDSEANTNSRMAAMLLSFLIPFFLVATTKSRNEITRTIKFGTGMIVYFILVLVLHNFVLGVVTMLYPCIAIFLATLFYGHLLLPGKADQH